MLDGVFKKLRSHDRDRLQFSSVEVRLVMDQAYDQKYNLAINDDGKPPNPMGVTAFYWTEDCEHYSGLPERIRTFYNYNMGQHLNCSFMEFMENPKWLNDLLILEAKSYINRKAAEASNLTNGNKSKENDSPTDFLPT
jgi:hypothetical protein